MTEMFGEAWPPMSAPDLAPDDDDILILLLMYHISVVCKTLLVKERDTDQSEIFI